MLSKSKKQIVLDGAVRCLLARTWRVMQSTVLIVGESVAISQPGTSVHAFPNRRSIAVKINLPAVFHAECLHLNEQVLKVDVVILNQSLKKDADEPYHANLAVFIGNITT